MSETIFRNIMLASSNDSEPSEKRAAAVAAALEVIAAKALGAEGTNVQLEFNRLSEYADRIQQALTVE